MTTKMIVTGSRTMKTRKFQLIFISLYTILFLGRGAGYWTKMAELSSIFPFICFGNFSLSGGIAEAVFYDASVQQDIDKFLRKPINSVCSLK